MDYSRIIYKKTLIICLVLGFISNVWAQKAKVELGKKEIALNETFTISISIENGKFKKLSKFPDLRGFKKYGRSTETSSSTDASGNSVVIEKITQSYLPTKMGTFDLPFFSMFINGTMYKTEKFTIVVKDKSGNSGGDVLDPDDPFFTGEEKVEVYTHGKDVFLALTTNKDEVYVGEEFNTTLALYVAKNSPRYLDFVDLNEQLQEILKKIKPANCWEEDFNIDRLYPITVMIDGKEFSQYKIYQASFFSFNAQDIEIPSVSFTLTDQNYNRSDDRYFLTLESDPLQIHVKELPPHPLKDKVMVGKFYLDERASETELKTGESFTYNFAIVGDGNIINIPNPEIKENAELDFYPPLIKQVIKRQNNKVTGAKVFGHYVIPKEPGDIPLKDHLSFIYFDVKKEKYDTLYPKTVLHVTGQKLKDKQVKEYDGFYKKIEESNDVLTTLNQPNYWRKGINIFLGLSLFITIAYWTVLRFKNKNNEK